MQAAELRKSDIKDLQKQLADLRREHFNLRMQSATSQLTQTHRFKQVKRDIARIRTVMREKVGE